MILGSDTVTVLRGKSRDAWGDTAGADTGTDVAGCLVQPSSSTEQTTEGDLVVTNLTVFLPAGADVLVTDRVGWNGRTYEVDGTPQPWHDQAANDSHVQVQLKLVQGSD